MNDKTEAEPIPNQPQAPNEAKQARWDEVAAQVDEIVDAEGRHIDEGIKETVIALNLSGIETEGSCEGHTDHGVASPWLDITSEGIRKTDEERKGLFDKIERQGDMDEETERRIEELNLERTKEQAKVIGLLAEFYQERHVPYEMMIVVRPFINGRIQCIGTEVAELLPPEQKDAKLKQFQAEMSTFTQFLRDKYFGS